MLDLAKFIKQLKYINADLPREILENMKEAVHLIVSGAILCHSFITCKNSKFLWTPTICGALVDVLEKVDRIKQDLHLQMELKTFSSVTFNMSRQQQPNDNEGGTEETRYPAEELALQQCNLGGANIHCEIEETCETDTHKMEVQSDTESSLLPSNGQVEHGCYKKQLPLTDNSKTKNRNQPQAFHPRRIPRPAKMLKTIAHRLHKFTGNKFKGRECSYNSEFEIQLSSLAINLGFRWLPISFSIQELEIATKGFQCKLGQGRFGCVYKGTLATGRQVVVKRAQKETTGLKNELVSITKLHHRNILELVGFCIERKEVMLVYDYMPNGNLSDILFDSIKKQVLDWHRRFNIILEVISALAFVHEYADVAIVHRHIKPANILLDENFNARIADFRLAIALQDNMDELTPLTGTVGYIAPECKVGGHVTEKADIYSFGILVLNLVSGKRYIEFTSVNDGPHNLVEPALMLPKENRLIELIDPELVKGSGFDSGDISRAIIIALLCLQTDPVLRPRASQVSVMLSTKEMEIPRTPVELPPELNNVYNSIPLYCIQHSS